MTAKSNKRFPPALSEEEKSLGWALGGTGFTCDETGLYVARHGNTNVRTYKSTRSKSNR